MPQVARPGDEVVEVLEGAEVGVDRVVAALGEPIAQGEPTSCGPAERVLFGALAEGACRSGGSGGR